MIGVHRALQRCFLDLMRCHRVSEEFYGGCARVLWDFVRPAWGSI